VADRLFPIDSQQGVNPLLFRIRLAGLADGYLAPVGERQPGGCYDMGSEQPAQGAPFARVACGFEPATDPCELQALRRDEGKARVLETRDL
jgi:hypothetical protein